MAAVNPTRRIVKGRTPKRSKGATVRPELASTILVESTYLKDDAQVAARYNISTRTVARLRAKATYDAELSALVREKQAILRQNWSCDFGPLINELKDALSIWVAKARESKFDPATGPDVGRMMIGGLKILSEIEIAQRELDRRSAEAGPVLPEFIPDKQLNPAPEDAVATADYIDVEAE